MSGGDVPNDDMPNFLRPARQDVLPLSDAALAALLGGTEPPQEPAPGLRPVADVLAALRADPTSDELAGQASALTEFRRGAGAAVPARGSRRRRERTSFFGTRAAAAALAAALGLGGLATAAYAGVLPAPVQRLAHEAIGAPAPQGASPAGTHLPRKRLAPSNPAPIAGAGASRLCTDYLRTRADGTPAQQAIARHELIEAAGGAGKVSAYCRTVAHPKTSLTHPAHPARKKKAPPGRVGKSEPPGRAGKGVPPGHKDKGVPPGRKGKGVPPGHQPGHHAAHSNGNSSSHSNGRSGANSNGKSSAHNDGKHAQLAVGTSAQQNPRTPPSGHLALAVRPCGAAPPLGGVTVVAVRWAGWPACYSRPTAYHLHHGRPASARGA